jgi:hypothetical protein
MQLSPALERYWQLYLATRPDGIQPNLDSDPIWRFGDTPEAATLVGPLVKTGIKPTTSA